MVNKRKVWLSVYGCRFKRLLLLIILIGVFAFLALMALGAISILPLFGVSHVLIAATVFVVCLGFWHARSTARFLDNCGQLIGSVDELGPPLSKAVADACKKRGVKVPPIRKLHATLSQESPVMMYAYAWKGPCLLFNPHASLHHADEIEANIAHELRHSAWDSRWFYEIAKGIWRWLAVIHIYFVAATIAILCFSPQVDMKGKGICLVGGVVSYFFVTEFVRASGHILVKWPHYSWWSSALLQIANNLGRYRGMLSIGVASFLLFYLVDPEFAAAVVDNYSVIVPLFVFSFILIRTYQRQVELEADALAALDQGTSKPLARMIARKGLPPNFVAVTPQGIARVMEYRRDNLDLFSRYPVWKERVARLVGLEEA
jgi:hypothetical protein